MIVQLLETASDLEPLEELQRSIWPGEEADIVPLHLLVTAAHNGGIILGAFEEDVLVGFAFGFPGFNLSDEDPSLKHCSHMVGVLAEYRDRGVGYLLKRAQWQLVRHQNIPLITWTYDPLQSRNAFFNIAKLGAICNMYIENLYGDMRDEVNSGLPSDRFLVELWVNSPRVLMRLDSRPRQRLSLDSFRKAGAEIINPTHTPEPGLLVPDDPSPFLSQLSNGNERPPLLLVEIPKDIQLIKTRSKDLSIIWRSHTQKLFTALFSSGYLVTDFIYADDSSHSSFYVLSHGEASLGGSRQ